MEPRKAMVVYATRYGQARKIGERIASSLEDAGLDVDVIDARRWKGTLPDDVALYVLVASIQKGKHEREMIRFVREQRETIARAKSAFVSVSMAEAEVEKADTPAERRAKAAETVREMLEGFFAATGWRPTVAKAAAGALAYREYNFFIRFIIKMIAKQGGLATDTSRDHEYTDWPAIDRFAAELARHAAC